MELSLKDCHAIRIVNPKNKHKYVLVCDDYSSSTHYIFGPRICKKWGSFSFELTDEQIQTLKDMRISDVFEDHKRYPLTEIL